MEERLQRRLLKQQKDWETQDERAKTDAVKSLLATADGRTFLYWLLQKTNAIGVTPFTGNALTTAFQCGEQNIGLQLVHLMLGAAPEGFFVLLKEKDDERAYRDNATNQFRNAAPSDDGDDSAGND